MRRFFMFAAIAAVVLALPLTHSALAAPAAKVKVCHLNSSNTPATYVYDYHYHYYTTDIMYHYEYTYSFGNVIEVSENAVAAHEGHGDSTSYGTLSDFLVDYFENWDQNDYSFSYDGGPDYYYNYNIDYTNGDIKNADCYVFSYIQS